MWPLRAVAQARAITGASAFSYRTIATSTNRIAAFWEGLGAPAPEKTRDRWYASRRGIGSSCPRWAADSSAETLRRSRGCPPATARRGRRIFHSIMRENLHPLLSTVGTQAAHPGELSPVSSSTCLMSAQKPCSCCARQCQTRPGSRGSGIRRAVAVV